MTKQTKKIEEVMDGVSNFCGLTNYGDPSFKQALDILYDSALNDSGMTGQQLDGFLNEVAGGLHHRLQVVHLLEQHPEILETPIRRPLYVTGLPRSGTTFLHMLLAEDPEARSLQHWELSQPWNPPTPETYRTDPRIEQVRAGLEAFYKQHPMMKTVHYLRADKADECNVLFKPSFVFNFFNICYKLDTYADWYSNSDHPAAYEFYKQQLQILSWKFTDCRWVLKAPSHLYFLDSLFQVMPDANVVQLHRNPVKVIGSVCSGFSYMRRMSDPNFDAVAFGKQWSALMERSLTRSIEARKNLPEQQFLDISYRDLVDEPIETVKRIYAHYDYPYTEAFEERMKDFIQNNERHKHGVHSYDVADFGLSEAGIREQFRDYSEYFDGYLESLSLA